MKKSILTILSILIIASTAGMTLAKPDNTSLAEAIKLYKAGNY